MAANTPFQKVVDHNHNVVAQPNVVEPPQKVVDHNHNVVEEPRNVVLDQHKDVEESGNGIGQRDPLNLEKRISDLEIIYQQLKERKERRQRDESMEYSSGSNSFGV